MKKHYKTYTYIILFLVADWFNIATTVLPGFGSLNIRIGDFFFVIFLFLYLIYLTSVNIKKSKINFIYIYLILVNLVGLYLGIRNTKLQFAIRDFQVILFSISFFVGLFVINDINDIKKFINLFLIAFLFRELFLLFTFGPRDGYLNRILALADPSSTSFLQNLAIYFLLVKYLTNSKNYVKVISITIAIYLIFTLIALGKMGGILTLSTGMLVLYLYNFKGKNLLKFSVLFALLLIFFIYVGKSDLVQSSVTRITEIENNPSSDPTSNWRLMVWAQGLNIFYTHFLFGGGYSWPNGWLYSPGQFGEIWGWGSALHNEYLHILSSGGVVGFSVFISFIIYVVTYFTRKINLITDRKDKLLITVFFASFISFLITGFTNPSWVLYVAMVGWFYGAAGFKYLQIKLGQLNENSNFRKLSDISIL